MIIIIITTTTTATTTTTTIIIIIIIIIITTTITIVSTSLVSLSCLYESGEGFRSRYFTYMVSIFRFIFF